MENNSLLHLLESELGKGQKRAHGNYAFECPFCKNERARLGKSKKNKLEIQLITNMQGENPYACWFCRTRGKTIKSLFKKLGLKTYSLNSVLSPTDLKIIRDNSISLPKEFTSLSLSQSSWYSKKVLSYLRNRGLTQEDIIKYNIGYCMNGQYADRIIIPSYDESGELNYFEARDITGHSSIRYLKPDIDRDEVIGFELFINWNTPIILCEGMFDAISAKRNAIPLLGKTFSIALMNKIVTSQVKKIYLALDSDALETSLEYAEQLLDRGKKVYLVELKDKDISAMGFDQFTKQIHEAKPLVFEDLIKKRLELI